MASTMDNNKEEIERLRAERVDLLKHLRGQRTQAMPKHSLFGTSFEIFSKEEEKAIGNMPSTQASYDPQKVNRRFLVPIGTLPQSGAQRLENMRDNITKNEADYAAFKKNADRAKYHLELLDSSSKYIAVKGLDRQPEYQGQARSQSTKGSKGLKLREYPYGHPSEETMSMANSPLALRPPVCPHPAIHGPIGKASGFPRGVAASNMQPVGSYTSIDEHIPTIYFRRRRRYRVTPGQQFDWITRTAFADPERPYAEEQHLADQEELEEYEEQLRDKLRTIPKNIAHTYKTGQMAELLNNLSKHEQEQEGSGNLPGVGAAGRLSKMRALSGLEKVEIPQPASFSKTVHSNLFAHPLFDKSPDNWRHTADGLQKWKEASIVRDRVFKEWETRQAEEKDKTTTRAEAIGD